MRIQVQDVGRRRVSPGFVVDDAMMVEFRAQLESRGVMIDEDAFATDETFILGMLHYEIDLALFSVEEARRNLTAHDPQAQFAITLFPEAERLLSMSRQTERVVAGRD